MKNPDSSSTSFLESIFKDEVVQNENISEDRKPAKLPIEIIDPVFFGLEVRIPRTIEKFFKSVGEIKYIYSITDSHFLEIFSNYNNRALFRAKVSYFETFYFKDDGCNLIFIIGRDAFKKKNKSEMSKNYKMSLEGSAEFHKFDKFENLKEKYLHYQIQEYKNFVFIDEPETLHLQIKNLVNLLTEEKEYLPRVKKAETGLELLKNVLEKISGVSECVSLSILKKYNTFESIQNALKSKSIFLNIEIYNKDGQVYRNMSEKLYSKIKKVFLSEEAGAII